MLLGTLVWLTGFIIFAIGMAATTKGWAIAGTIGLGVLLIILGGNYARGD